MPHLRVGTIVILEESCLIPVPCLIVTRMLP
jgi:hypothetical protein